MLLAEQCCREYGWQHTAISGQSDGRQLAADLTSSGILGVVIIGQRQGSPTVSVDCYMDATRPYDQATVSKALGKFGTAATTRQVSSLQEEP